MSEDTDNENKLGFLNILVIILSIYVLLALLIETFYQLPKETAILLQYIDFGICGLFFIEFSFRFYHAKSKLQFMKWGWIDLISCIPMIDMLRAGRLFRLIRLLRIVRAFKIDQSTN